MDRREFMKSSTAILCAGIPGARLFAEMARHPLAGKTLPKWEKGHFRISLLYTGRSESAFLVFADGTSMLIDCGDYKFGGEHVIPYLPDDSRSAGEYTARYVLRENPNGKKVDYFMLSHYHSDHAGSQKDTWGRSKNGKFWLSGLGAAIEHLDIDTAIDRSWPNMDDPAPRPYTFESGQTLHIREVYQELLRRGAKVEKFRLEKGSDQIKLRHGGSPMFAFTPLCSAGQILRRDDTVLDLVTEAMPRSEFNENMLSAGLVLSHGPFRYYTAGDFAGTVKMPDGKRLCIEGELAKEVPQVDVAKANHHACWTMNAKLAAALHARVVMIGCWHMVHAERGAMRRMSSVKSPCLYVPGYFAKRRREEEASEAWMKDIAPETYDGVHSVIDVAPDGKTYRLMIVDAHDEKGTILGAYDFETRKKVDLAT